MIDSGQSKVVDSPAIRFTPIGPDYGKLITNDPKVIAAVEARIKNSGGQASDIMTEEQWRDAVRTPEQKLAQVQQEAQRTITAKNRLIEELERQKAELEAKLNATAKPKTAKNDASDLAKGLDTAAVPDLSGTVSR